MRFFSYLPFLFFCLLAACAGAGMSGGGPVGGPPAGIVNHAAPGMDEVALAPGVDHTDESKNYMKCENVDVPNAKPSTGTVKFYAYYLDQLVGPGRWIRVAEQNYNRYRYLKTDAEGSITFTFDLVMPRGVAFQILDTAPANDIPLNTTFPCKDEFCVASVSDPVKEYNLHHLDSSCALLNGAGLNQNMPEVGKVSHPEAAPADTFPVDPALLDGHAPLKETGTLEIIDTNK